VLMLTPLIFVMIAPVAGKLRSSAGERMRSEEKDKQ